jgi:hypothetical protein
LGGPQSRSGRFGENKILDTIGTRTPTPSIVQPVVSRYTDYAIPAPTRIFVPEKNIIKICNEACLLNIQIYIKIDELLFLPDKSLLIHNHENSSHRLIVHHERRVVTEWRQPTVLPAIPFHHGCIDIYFAHE